MGGDGVGAGRDRASGFPLCRACADGELVPLSDYGGQGSAVHYKAWVCTNPDCGYNLKIRNGEVSMNEPVTDVDGAPAPPSPGRLTGANTLVGANRLDGTAGR